MSRNTTNFVIDLVSALTALGMIATGLIMRFVLPPGSGQTNTLWSLTRHEWGDVHFWLAVGLGSVILLHVAMHWSWVCGTTTRLLRISLPNDRRSPVQYVSGAATLVCVIAALALMLRMASTKEQPQIGQRSGQMREDASGIEAAAAQVRGSMSLAELAATSGMSLDTLKQRLGLPADTDAEEKLGQLRQRYGFSLTDVRRIVHQGQAERRDGN